MVEGNSSYFIKVSLDSKCKKLIPQTFYFIKKLVKFKWDQH